jgi:hypothetical protein
MPKRKTRSTKTKTKRRKGFRAFEYTSQIFPMRMKAQDVSYVEDDMELKDLQQECDAVAFYLNDRFYRMDMEALRGLTTGPDIPDELPDYETSEEIPDFGRQGIAYPCAKHEGDKGGLASVNDDIPLFNFGAAGMPQVVCEYGDIRSIVDHPDTSARVFQLVDTGVVIPAIASWKAVNHVGNYTGGAGLSCSAGPVKLVRVVAARLGSRPDRKNIPRDGPRCSTTDGDHFHSIKEWLDTKEREVKHEVSYAPMTILDEIREMSGFATFIEDTVPPDKKIQFAEFVDRYNKLPSDIKWPGYFATIMDGVYMGRDAWQSQLKLGEVTPVQYGREIGLQDWVMSNDPGEWHDWVAEASADDNGIHYPRHRVKNYPVDLVAKMDAKFGRQGWANG